MPSDPVRAYLDEIGQFELLTAGDETNLNADIQRGRKAFDQLDSANGNLSEDAKFQLEELVLKGNESTERFINSNLRLVVSIARRYQNRGLDFLELIQDGNMGLIHAVEKYDYRKGFKFSTYGTWWIRQSITRGLADKKRTIRVPVHMHDVIIAVHDASQKLEKMSGSEPTPEEIAEEAGLKVEKVKLAMGIKDTVSLQEPVGEDGANIGDFIPDSVDVEAEVLANLRAETIKGRELDEVLSVLDERERDVLTKCYGLNGEPAQTLNKIGAAHNITRERARQIRETALGKIRRLFGEDSLGKAG